MKRLIPANLLPQSLVLLFALGALAACATTPEPSRIASREPPPRDPADLSWSLEQGANTVEGRIGYATRAGGAFTCAGQSIALTPQGPSSAERMVRLYGSTEHAVATVETVRTRSTGLP